MENIDLTQTVTSDTVNMLSAGGIVIISCIFVLMFIFFKRYRAKFIPLITGIIGYIVFCFIGYSVLSALVYLIPGIANQSEQNTEAVTVLFLMLSVLMFTVARIVLTKMLQGRYDGPGDVMMLGLGLGMGDAVMYAFSTFTMIVWCSAINSSGLAEVFRDFTEVDAISTYNDISILFTAPAIHWILCGISAVLDIVLNIALAMVNYGVTDGKLPKYWYAISTAMNFCVLLPFKFYDRATFNGTVIPFAIKAVAFAAVIYIVYQVNVKYLDSMLSYNGKNAPKAGGSHMPKFGKLNQK